MDPESKLTDPKNKKTEKENHRRDSSLLWPKQMVVFIAIFNGKTMEEIICRVFGEIIAS